MQGKLETGSSLHCPQNTGRTRHIRLHLPHIFRRLDRDATGIEGNPFSNKRNNRLAFPFGLVFKHREGWRMIATLVDRK